MSILKELIRGVILKSRILNKENRQFDTPERDSKAKDSIESPKDETI